MVLLGSREAPCIPRPWHSEWRKPQSKVIKATEANAQSSLNIPCYRNSPFFRKPQIVTEAGKRQHVCRWCEGYSCGPARCWCVHAEAQALSSCSGPGLPQGHLGFREGPPHCSEGEAHTDHRAWTALKETRTRSETDKASWKAWWPI